MLNSSKRSVVLDLKTDAGRQALLDLAATADVLIENFAPGTMERLQLGPERLLEHNPRLVVASGKGYGSTGPYAHMSAMDITVQAMSGAAAATGEPDGPPTKAGASFVDFSGGIHLFGAISAALFQRERTGRGRSSRSRCTTPSTRCWPPAWAACTTIPTGSSPSAPGTGIRAWRLRRTTSTRRATDGSRSSASPSGTGAAWPPRWAGLS